MRLMRRLLIVAFAALVAVSLLVQAEGPDDRYLEIYKLIQEGDQFVATGQPAFAKERYSAAQADLKKLQTSYPGWNPQLVEYRLRTLETKLRPLLPAPAADSATTVTNTAAPSATQAQPQKQLEADDRDNQIRGLREQVDRLQSERSVLEAKLREAVSAQPAAVDPRELAKAEERIRALEREREVLKVSVDVAELKAAKQSEAASPELKQALADAKRDLNQQLDVIAALRQEKEVLQQHLQSAKRDQEEALAGLTKENDTLKQQIAAKPAQTEVALGTPQMASELASTKAALESSRETMSSLQARVRTLQEERDRLDKTRKDLEAKVAAPAVAKAGDAAKIKQIEKERDALQKQLKDAQRQLADNKGRGKASKASANAPIEDVSGLRARLEVLEATKVPYTPEELALFKKPTEPAAVMAASTPAPPQKELSADASTLLAEAQRAFGARRFDEAEKKYQEVLQIDAKNVATLQRLASAQLEQSRPQDADATLKRALDENPKDARSLLLMGIAKFDQDKFDDAFDNLSRSAQVDPQNAETQNYLGITLSQKGQRAGAETALRKAIQLAPNYASAHYNLAVVYATQQPPFTELARWHYQKSVAFGHPESAEVEKMLEKKAADSPK